MYDDIKNKKFLHFVDYITTQLVIIRNLPLTKRFTVLDLTKKYIPVSVLFVK